MKGTAGHTDTGSKGSSMIKGMSGLSISNPGGGGGGVPAHPGGNAAGRTGAGTLANPSNAQRQGAPGYTDQGAQGSGMLKGEGGPAQGTHYSPGEGGYTSND